MVLTPAQRNTILANAFIQHQVCFSGSEQNLYQSSPPRHAADHIGKE